MTDAIRSRFAFLLAIAATGAGSALYFVTSDGTPTEDPASIARVCNLPGNIPGAILDALAIPRPTQPNGTGTGRCLPPADAEDGYRKLRVLGAIAPAWRAGSLTSIQCAAGLLSLEFGIPSMNIDPRSLVLVQVCGPAPTAAMTEDIERLERLPETDVDIRWTSAKYGRGTEPAIRAWPWGSFPAAFASIAPCACCARGQACTVTGLPLPDGGTYTGAGSALAQYEAAKVTGTGRRGMACGIHAMVAQARGANSTFDPACQ